MIRRTADCLARVIATVLTAAPFFCTGAQADPTAGIGVAGNVEYSNNPYLLDSANTGAVRARISVAPFIEEQTTRSSLRVSADASYSAYNRRYRSAIDLSSQVGYSSRLSRQFSVRAGMSLNSSIGSGYITSAIFEPPSTTNVLPPAIDLTLIGFQDRSTQVQANAGLTYSLDDKNSISIGYDGSVTRYPGTAGRSEYSNIRQNVSYSRVVSPRISLGASVNVSRINYLGGPLGDAVIISPSLNGNFRIAARWTLSAGIGFSSSRVDIGIGKLKSTDLSGNASFCRTDARTSFCMNAARSTAASSFDGVRTTSTAGLSYSYRLSARDSLSASGGYSRGSAPKRVVGLPTSYFSGSASYSRRFSNRMMGNITGGFSSSRFLTTRSSVVASIGINYNFGNK